jgi:hypothetical protein
MHNAINTQWILNITVEVFYHESQLQDYQSIDEYPINNIADNYSD